MLVQQIISSDVTEHFGQLTALRKNKMYRNQINNWPNVIFLHLVGVLISGNTAK